MRLPSLSAVRAERAERSLREFVRQAWHVVEPHTDYVHGWHIDAICDHLQAVTEGQIRQLIINVPPGHMKSLLTCVFWPAWEWARWPQRRWLFASYSSELSVRDSNRMKRLVQSEWYQGNWGDGVRLVKEHEKTLVNEQTGFRVASSVGGIGTGERVHRAVSDDLLRVNDALSDAARRAAVEHMKAMSTRGVNPVEFAQVLIMQRLHQGDPTGWALEQGGWEVLRLPAEFESARPCATSIGWADPRARDGELLWPAQFPASEIARLKVALGSWGASGQLQQSPSPAGGGMVKRAWFGRYATPPSDAVRVVQSWDTAKKPNEINDYSVCETFLETANAYYLLDVYRERLEYPDLLRAIKSKAAQFSPHAILIEDAASGTSAIQELSQETMLPVVAVPQPREAKVIRLQAVLPVIEAGRLHLPETAPWLADFELELTNFPNALHDDQVDPLSQFLSWARAPSEIFIG